MRTGLISSRSLRVHSRSAFSLVVVLKGLRVHRCGHSQFSPERAPTDRRLHARFRVVHPRTPAGQDATQRVNVGLYVFAEPQTPPKNGEPEG